MRSSITEELRKKAEIRMEAGNHEVMMTAERATALVDHKPKLVSNPSIQLTISRG